MGGAPRVAPPSGWRLARLLPARWAPAKAPPARRSTPPANWRTALKAFAQFPSKDRSILRHQIALLVPPQPTHVRPGQSFKLPPPPPPPPLWKRLNRTQTLEPRRGSRTRQLLPRRSLTAESIHTNDHAANLDSRPPKRLARHKAPLIQTTTTTTITPPGRHNPSGAAP